MDEEIIILPIDICRICTNLQSNLDILTDKLEDEHVLLHEALEFVSCIRIDFDDGMSRTMCLTCSKRLSDAYKFKNQILDSYRTFYNQTSDFNFKNEDSIQENNSAITAVEANSMERANELGIKLSTDAVSFLLEHNNCKIRNKKEPLSIEENLIAEDESATVEQIQTEENEPPLIESNQVDNNEAPSIEVETPTIEQVLSEENEFTVELKEMEENEHSIEVIQTEENEYTIKLIQVEENEPPSIENNQADNAENPSIECNQINNIEPLSIEKYNKSPPTPNSRIRKRNLTSSDKNSSKCSQKKLPTKNNKTEKYKLSCHICHKILPKISNLKDHLRLHANEKNFVCSFCQKAFVQIANYRTHLRVHTKERPYHCHLCSKTYSQASSLKTHVRSHTNEKNHFCDVCYKGFTNSSDLKKHKIIHDVSRQFACETCGHLFSQKANLRVHERNIHLRLNK